MFTIPLLYLIYDEAVSREANDNMETGISVGGRIINTIRYADMPLPPPSSFTSINTG